MANVQNSLVKQKTKFSVAISSEQYRKLINSTLGDPKRAQRFIAAISSAVATNTTLQECDAGSILSAALLGEALNLSPSPQLGQFYMVPYNDKKKDCKVAQFQLGYKGYIQLAIRSGQYKKLNVLAIKEGELVNFNPLEEEIEVKLIDDEFERENAKTIGYYAMFEYVNGFKKAMYWSREKMESHADRFSQAYNAATHKKMTEGLIHKDDLWKYSSFWYKDFDGMAFKTMLRQLISKWGIMSIELQSAVENDMTVVNEDGTKEYIDTVEYAEPISEQPVTSGNEEPETDPAIETDSSDPLA